MDEAPVSPWFVKSGEDWSVYEWWQAHANPGWLLMEVKLGQGGPGDWPNRRSHRRLDALHIPGHPRREVTYWGSEFDELADAVRGRRVELIEAKRRLNYDVIGQCIAGVTMFSRAYPMHGPVQQVAIVRGEIDPALRWVCDRRNIQLDVLDESLIRSRVDVAARLRSD
jgi:hypothetical protein